MGLQLILHVAIVSLHRISERERERERERDRDRDRDRDRVYSTTVNRQVYISQEFTRFSSRNLREFTKKVYNGIADDAWILGICVTLISTEDI